MNKILFFLFCILLMSMSKNTDRSINLHGFFFYKIPYEIVIPGSKNDDISLSTNNIKVLRKFEDRSGTSILFSFDKERNGSLSVYDSSENKNIFNLSAKIRTPNVYFSIDGKYYPGDTIPLNKLVHWAIRAENLNFDIDAWVNVKKFTIITYHNGYPIESLSDNYKFSEKQKDLILSSDKNLPLIVQNIEVDYPRPRLDNIPLLYYMK